MAKILDQARYKCALAAMQTVQSIPGAIPILHSGPGCASKLNDNNGTSGKFSANIFPCTSISEKEVVFGGAEKLRTTIQNALRVIDADLFVVLSGCTGEIIGDDIQSVAEDFQDEVKPVVWTKTPGFKGNNYIGHDWILHGIFEQYVSKFADVPKEKGLVNLFAGVPQQDPYWLGNLRELETLLQSIGLKTNTVFGFGRGVENLQKIPAAEYTILVSPWAGIESAKYLEKAYGTKLLHYPTLPIGATETSKFLRTVGEFTGADKELVESVIRENEAHFFYYLERYADTILESRIVSKRFTVVSEAQYVISVAKFLVNDMGFFPEKLFVVDDTPENFRGEVEKELKSLNYGIQADVEFSTDGHAIHDQIRQMDFAGTPLIIGSNWEKVLARDVKGHFVNISYPMIEKIVINSHVAGYSGALYLLEEIYTAALAMLKI